MEPAAQFKPDPVHQRIEVIGIAHPHVAGQVAAES
jgi:hypothetical protein